MSLCYCNGVESPIKLHGIGSYPRPWLVQCFEPRWKTCTYCLMWAWSLWLLLNLWVLKSGPIFKFISTTLHLFFCFFLMFPVWWQCYALSCLFDGLEKKSTLGFWYHLGWRGDRQDLLGWVVVFIPVGWEPGRGYRAPGPLMAALRGIMLLKTNFDSSLTFATFWSHKWCFWERLRWDPFQKEEGRRAIEPNGTQENHFMRLK